MSTAELLLAGALRGAIEVSMRKITDLAEVRRALESAGGSGWVSFTDRVEVWKGGPLGPGIPLSAELSLGERESIQLRRSGEAWLFTTLSERAEGDDYAFDEEFESTSRPARMAYRTWWRARTEEDGIRVWRPYASRFTGWREE